MKERLYNLYAINDKTGNKVLLTGYPDTHKHCCTMKGKFTPHKDVRIVLEEYTTLDQELDILESAYYEHHFNSGDFR